MTLSPQTSLSRPDQPHLGHHHSPSGQGPHLSSDLGFLSCPGLHLQHVCPSPGPGLLLGFSGWPWAWLVALFPPEDQWIAYRTYLLSPPHSACLCYVQYGDTHADQAMAQAALWTSFLGTAPLSCNIGQFKLLILVLFSIMGLTAKTYLSHIKKSTRFLGHEWNAGCAQTSSIGISGRSSISLVLRKPHPEEIC